MEDETSYTADVPPSGYSEEPNGESNFANIFARSKFLSGIFLPSRAHHQSESKGSQIWRRSSSPKPDCYYHNQFDHEDGNFDEQQYLARRRRRRTNDPSYKDDPALVDSDFDEEASRELFKMGKNKYYLRDLSQLDPEIVSKLPVDRVIGRRRRRKARRRQVVGENGVQTEQDEQASGEDWDGEEEENTEYEYEDLNDGDYLDEEVLRNIHAYNRAKGSQQHLHYFNGYREKENGDHGEPFNEEYSDLGNDSFEDEELDEEYICDEQGHRVIVRKVPIWRPVQRLINWGIAQVFKLVMMTFWLLRQISRGLFENTTKLLKALTIHPLLYIGAFIRRCFSTLSKTLSNLLNQISSSDSNRRAGSFTILLFVSLVIMLLAILGGFNEELMKKSREIYRKHGGMLDHFPEIRIPKINLSAWPLIRGPGNGFIAPDLPPSTVQELSDRLMALELSLQKLYKTSNDIVKRSQDFERESIAEAHERAQQVALLATKLQELSASMQNTARHVHSTDGVALNEIRQSMQQTEHDINEMRAKMDALENNFGKTSKEVRSLHTSFDNLKGELKGLHRYVDDIASGEAIARRVSMAIEKYLPNHLIVRMNSHTGKLEVEPEFWLQLKNMFTTNEKLDSSVDQLRKEFANIRKAEHNNVNSMHPSLSWKDFVQNNEQSISTFIRQSIDDMTGENGLIVSKKDFMSILGEEVKRLRKDLETQAIQHQNQKPVQHQEAVERAKMQLGDDATEIISEMIDEALLRYSSDVLGMPDYALASGGARIIPTMTSKTYSVRPGGFFGQISASLFSVGIKQGMPPVAAIHPDTHVGQCWPFHGSQGNLGILLSRPIVVTDLTVEHVNKDVAIDLGSAPQRIEVWGIKDKDPRKQVKTEPKTTKGSHEHEALEAEKEEPLDASLQTARTIMLASFDYDIHARSPIQSFSVPRHLHRKELAVRAVQFRIKSNWGNKEYTCIYRVRVHGKEI
ncbi:uncharacterized protein VTP21DRAFT_4342 [Calcarisporiella thermophila]|uniref:uncharacterized protein n=1 Tax=Calcarisporiella thermophila TaxID=911321 RepID=UPI0037422E90